MARTTLVLAMHGAPPNDFPGRELGEFFDLHTRLEHAQGKGESDLLERYARLEAKMRAWPRTPRNDPFFAGSQEIARALESSTGMPVLVGFNEFCAPSLDEAFNQAVGDGVERVLVVTPMMTRGGEHAEVDIPQALRHAQERHPGVEFQYVWPFEVAAVAAFLRDQVEKFTQM